MIAEISEVGMTCVSGATVERGEEYIAVWHLPDSHRPLQVTCVAREVAPDYARVEFVNLALTDRSRIASYIAARLPLRSAEDEPS